MKRWLLYGILFSAAVLVPVNRADVGKLHPVQTVSISYHNEQVVLQTDTGEMGVGETTELALENLKQTAPAIIYLDTAEFLLVEENALRYVADLRRFLESSIRVCLVEPEVELDQASKYLQIHGNLPKLKQWNTGGNLPVLTKENERIILLENLQKKS